jgi:BirA family biotin operon repressor/biotin-[acetyl-CoA-carboxylase] ligase
VVIAGQQNAGRGRLGRDWFSADPGNLYASVYFRPLLAPARMAHITLWLGLAVCDYLNRAHSIPVMIKWPNDLLLDGKKVAGMLSESRIDADVMRDFIFGIGLNINGNPAKWPADIRERATSLAHWQGDPLPFASVTAGCIHAIVEGWKAFAADPASNRLTELWPRYDALAGNTLNAWYANQQVTGTARGINSDGTLRLELENGTTIALSSGEVTLSKR